MKNALLSEVNVLCLHFSAKSMTAEAEDVMCREKKKVFPNKEKDGVAVKGRGDPKMIKWLYTQCSAVRLAFYPILWFIVL